MENPGGAWILVWEGDEQHSALAEDMLTGNGLEVHRREEDKIRLFVRPNDRDIAQDIFRDWHMG